jgi:hypothetical protein
MSEEGSGMPNSALEKSMHAVVRSVSARLKDWGFLLTSCANAFLIHSRCLDAFARY